MRKLALQVNYANIVASLALFIALGGAAYAVTTAEKNSVVSKSIKTGAVKSADLAQNAIDSRHVTNGGLLSEDFGAGQIPSGPPGEPGADASNLFAYVREEPLAATTPAILEYGEGATSVSDPNGASEYTVSFDRSLAGCVAHADGGRGQPSGGSNSVTDAAPAIFVEPDSVRVSFRVGSPSVLTDTSFMLSVLC